MAHYEPQRPFDGYDELQNAEYVKVMQQILDDETFGAERLALWVAENIASPLVHSCNTFGPGEIFSVIDVGCGPGTYILPLKNLGFSVFGIDACTAAGSLLSRKEYRRVDLRFPWRPAQNTCSRERFDLCICFEVAEHLEEHWAKRLIYTLADCADVILFTAATPGQGGTFHENEQPHAYWVDLFYEERDYLIHPLTWKMREFLETLLQDPLVLSGEKVVAPWLLANSFIFVNSKTKIGDYL